MAVAAQAACWKGPAVKAAGRARAECTPNMYPMFVTLDVSRLSGWLNAAALCRVEMEAQAEGRHAGPVAGGRGVAAAVQATCRERSTVDAAARARGERTENMNPMSVTPEVSQLDMSALNWFK